MATGTVKWFNDAKGYGFITPPKVARTCSSTTPRIAGTASSTLAEGETGGVRGAEGPKGLQATNVVEIREGGGELSALSERSGQESSFPNLC